MQGAVVFQGGFEVYRVKSKAPAADRHRAGLRNLFAAYDAGAFTKNPFATQLFGETGCKADDTLFATVVPKDFAHASRA